MSERVDRMLRRASDDVSATITRSATPPPLDELDRPRSWWATATAVALLLAGVVAALVVVLDRSGDDQLVATDPSIASQESTSGVPGATRTPSELCRAVTDVATDLAAGPSTPAEWRAFAVEVDELSVVVEGSVLSEPVRRRSERFVALARDAAELGAGGGNTPAAVRGDEALAVAREFVGFAKVPDCRFEAEAVERGG